MPSSTWQATTDYFRSVWDYQPFWSALVQADLQRRYRRSFLGLGWSLLQPLGMTLVLGLVYRRLFNISFWDFAPLLLSGLAFWTFFSSVVLRGCESLVGAEPYIRQQPMPLIIFPLRAVLSSGFHFLIALTLAIVWAYFRGMVKDPLALFSLIPTLALLFLFGWAVAIVAAFGHAFFPDMQHLAELSLQALMFLTPIMYPPELLAKADLGFLLQVNPLAIFVGMIREPILHGQVPSLAAYALVSGLVAIPIVAAGYIVSRWERQVIFAL
jgi:ABC-type polysaccharide/polyol phosphate export permease